MTIPEKWFNKTTVHQGSGFVKVRDIHERLIYSDARIRINKWYVMLSKSILMTKENILEADNIWLYFKKIKQQTKQT